MRTWLEVRNFAWHRHQAPENMKVSIYSANKTPLGSVMPCEGITV